VHHRARTQSRVFLDTALRVGIVLVVREANL
jgi:hypothetical protein